MTDRVYNFSPGPATLPVKVIQHISEDLLCLPGAGASVLEISHRSKEFGEIHQQAKTDLRFLLELPDDYEILFLQGGARLQFSMVPMNLLGEEPRKADYILTGSWSKYAIEQAKIEGDIHVAWDGAESKYSRLPKTNELSLRDDAKYVYYASNETIQGVQYQTEPEVGDIPLVCDASSEMLYRPVQIEKYGLYYGCAQKNLGPAGVTIVVLRKDLLERCPKTMPAMLDYRNHVAQDSLYNTAPTFGIYAVGLVLQWMRDEFGDLVALYEHNQKKAALLYDVLDASDGFYKGHAAVEDRSLMNVVFTMRSDELTEKFVREAEERNLYSLKGHRSVGGLRASIYNAMPIEGVELLRDFMVEFRTANA